MDVLHLISDNDRRGAQVFAMDLSKAMGRLGSSNEVLALVPGRTNGLEVETLAKRRWSASGTQRLRCAMARSDVTVAHGSTTLAACSLASLASDLQFVYRQISDTRFWANSRFRKARVRWYMSNASTVVCLAPSAKAAISDYLGIERAKLHVIPNGVPGRQFKPADLNTKKNAVRYFGLNPRWPTIASVAALVPEKGVELLIDSTATIPEAQLLIVGDGPERPALEKQASIMLPGRCSFAGSIDNPRMAYAAADIVALASRGGDSMPATLIEASLAGLPVVSTNVGAIGEIVEDGVTGILLPSAERDALSASLRVLLSSTELRDRLGSAGRKKALMQFEIGVVAKQWTGLLRSIQ